MESQWTIGYLILAGISIASIICFFVLCNNVAKIAKNQVSNYDEYTILEKIGEKEKAFYHLKRALASDELKGITDEQIESYISKFERLGMGLPNMDILKNKK